MDRRDVTCWMVAVMLAVCWVVAGCKTTEKVRHGDEARTARAAKMRRNFEHEINLLDLRRRSHEEKATWARAQIDIRLDMSRFGDFSAGEIAFATEPLFKCYLKSLKKLSKKASKPGEERASFILERELRRYRRMREDKIVRIEKTALAPLLGEIDALCDEMQGELRRQLEFPGAGDD